MATIAAPNKNQDLVAAAEPSKRQLVGLELFFARIMVAIFTTFFVVFGILAMLTILVLFVLAVLAIWFVFNKLLAFNAALFHGASAGLL